MTKLSLDYFLCSNFLKSRNSQSGQTLLIILLIAAVVLTVGLAVASRSVTDVRISEQSDDAARAYSAAEAGIEEALLKKSSGSGSFSETGASYQTAFSGLGQNQTEIGFPQRISRNSPQTVWLADHVTLNAFYNYNAIRVLWGSSGTNADNAETPAMELLVYYNDNGTVKTGRYAVDPNESRADSVRPANDNTVGFCDSLGDGSCTGITSYSESGEGTSDGGNFQFGATFSLANFVGGNKTLLFARIKLLFTNQEHSVGVKTAGSAVSLPAHAFPSQGDRIESTGQSGDSVRRVEVIRYHPAPPSLFDFVLISGADISK